MIARGGVWAAGGIPDKSDKAAELPISSLSAPSLSPKVLQTAAAGYWVI